MIAPPFAERIEAILCDPHTGELLRRERDTFVCSTARYPIVRDVPRFVPSDQYVESFSFEWKVHSKTQVDSFRADRYSEDEFTAKTGFSAEDLRGKLVLDAGTGSGRYAELVSRWGGDVVGVDLSYAVDSAREILAERQNVWIAQANISALPFKRESFDVIFSIGVLHHTSDTRAHFLKLVPLLKPKGVIAVWVYPNEGEYAVRERWVRFVNKIPRPMFYAWCRRFVPWVQARLETQMVGLIRIVFPFSDQHRGLENDILDTFDAYSPEYHGIHSPEEVEGWFREAGLVDVCRPSGRNTCVRGVKPP